MKLRHYVYKHVIILLAILLALSSGSLNALSANVPSTSSETGEIVHKSLKKQEGHAYDPTDEVNIVVELTGESGVMVAQQENKRFSDLTESTKETLHNQAIVEQETVKDQIDASDISIEYVDEFTAVMNGFSANVLYKDIETIEQMNHVLKVYISEEYEQPIEPIKQILTSEDDLTEANTANEIVNARKVWEDVGYTGEGKVVAVIDRGIDVEHRDMVLSEETVPGLTEDDVQRKAEEQDLLGRYYTEKVPYGYNYADHNDTIKNIGEGASGHGIHVSGIVGANGDEANGGIKGVAPEVQILGMKVFSNDQVSSTNSSIYVKAIDDAIKLEADAINISLGSTARILNPEDPAQVAAKRATESGIFVAKSAGNGYYFGEGYDELPYAENPDIGVLSNIQLAEAAVEVANFENTHLDYAGLVYRVEGKEDQIVPFNPASKAPDPEEAIDEEMRDVVYVGYGRLPGDSDEDPTANDFENVDVDGKVVLIKRGGGVGYVDKTLNAQEHGAHAVIVFNNDDSGYKNMSSNSDVKIPQLFIVREHGEEMVEDLEQGKEVTIAFRDDRVKTENPRAGQMANSTAWGPMGGLDFKPSLTAAGSQILSTLNDDSYGVKSGTSMSTPQVAGGSTLVSARIQEDFDVSGLDLTMLTKNILMNTSKPIENISDTNKELGIEGVPYSPRRQGAGLMDLFAAVTTPVVITEKESGLAGVALKEIDDTFDFHLEVSNYNDEPITYHVGGNIQADLTDGTYNYLESVSVMKENGDIPITYSSHVGEEKDGYYQLTVPANETIDLAVSVDLTDTVDAHSMKSIQEHFINGRFIEGFIEFHDPNDVYPELNVPYVGFYGDWNEPPVLDEFTYDAERSFYNKAGLLTDGGTDDYEYLGIHPVHGEMTDQYAISPNKNGVNDNVLPALSFLRNAKHVEFVILDENGNELEVLLEKDSVRKHYNPSDAYTTFADAIWDGTIDGETVEDGLYYYAIKTKIDYKDVEWQVKKVPMYVDTIAPEVDASFDEELRQVQWEGEDMNGSGIVTYELVVNEDVRSGLLDTDTKSYGIDENIKDVYSIILLATDWAGNTAEISVYDGKIDSPSVGDMKTAIDELLNEGHFKNKGIAQSLKAKLDTVEHYERKDDKKKAIKNMGNFVDLLEKRYEKDMLTPEAYEQLYDMAAQLLSKWE